MRVLLISTYELGHQPLHLASPAAELSAAGHEVSAVDVAVQRWRREFLDGIDAVGISVPMHTALRLAIELATRVRRERPDVPVAFYGLYAGVSREATAGLADRLICGEYEDALVEWVGTLGGGISSPGTTVHLGRRRFRVPDRRGLPSLDRYAHLATPGGHELVGYVEASHGCRHRCAHCPVPAVYDGRYRVTGQETVVADIAQLVDAGAGHVTFGDPDFLNAPAYSLQVLEEAHCRFPQLTFDVTVKVEHIIRHQRHLRRMADAGILFIVSAMESLDDAILARLDKGHTAADAARSVAMVREAGMDIHPTWLPFTPWTSARSVADIARFLWEQDLAPVTDPVQLSIRLLIPDASLMLQIPDLSTYLIGYDEESLGYRWRSANDDMDRLQPELAAAAEAGAATGEDPLTTLASMSELIGAAAGEEVAVGGGATGAARPRLTEPWFC